MYLIANLLADLLREVIITFILENLLYTFTAIPILEVMASISSL
jgi:hypothetical protein